MKKLLSDRKAILLFTIPGLFLFLFVFVFPILMTLGLSFTEWDMVKAPVFTGIQNYVKLFTEDVNFKTSIKNMIIILGGVLLIQIPVALIIALLLDRITKGSRLLKSAYFVPVLFSATAVGLLWKRVFDYKFGVINAVFKLLGMSYQQLWLSNPEQAIWAVIIPVIWCKLGYYVIIFYAGIKAIPKDYYEASLLDGCNGIRATTRITLPLLHNVINACLVLGAIGALREYHLIFALTAGGPFDSTTTLAMMMYNYAFKYHYVGYASAVAVVLVTVCLVTSFLINKIYPTKDIQY